MQKKVVLALLMAALLAGGVFAEGFSMSAGTGLFFDFNVHNGVLYNGKYDGTRIMTLGVHGFFDATYAEADISLAYGKLISESDKHDFDSRMMQLGLAFLGKYPFELGDFTLFPLLGFDYNVVLSHTVAGTRDPEPGKWNQLGLLAGAGADFDLTDVLYLRGEGLFHIRLPNTFWKNQASAAGGSATFGMGPRIKIGVGYRF